MAYADKITTMRRFACIEGSAGIIFAEGVDIEGTLIYKLVGSDEVNTMTREELTNFLGDKDASIVYQDSEDEGYWEPRAFDKESSYYKGKEYKLPGFDNIEKRLEDLTIVSGKCLGFGDGECLGKPEYGGYCYSHRSHN